MAWSPGREKEKKTLNDMGGAVGKVMRQKNSAPEDSIK
jgi:hypothetical protein